MKQLIKSNLPFFIPYTIIWFCVLAMVLSTSKLEQMTFINSHNSLWADWFFYTATQMGEGWFWGLLIFAFLFIRYDRTLILVITLIVSTLISSSLKLYFDTLRPVAFFKNIPINWHFVEGLEIHIHQSFPSGHTTSGFAIFTLLALFSKNKNAGFFFVLMAWLVGYSRNYLFQHFPEDVLGGAVIGTFSSLVVYFVCTKMFSKTPRDWHKQSLLNR
jgi:membrane-associated phospholipid phosphatase